MQICILTQTHNHAGIPPLSFLQAGRPSCRQTNSSVYSGPKFWSPGPHRRGDILGNEIFYPLLCYLYAREIWASNLVNQTYQSEKSRLYSTESADSTSKTDDRLNRSTQLSPTLSTQLDSNVKRSTRSIDSIDFGVYATIASKMTIAAVN